jgi:acyl-CoA thioesterase-2
VAQTHLDLSRIFELEPHGPDTYVGESPRYEWGRIYGGLVVAQALCAAVRTVRPEHGVHSLHAYFILGGDLAEPVRYEVDRVRNGRSFTTRRVVARQSAGAILTLECSFQRAEDGPDTQSSEMPAGVPDPATLEPIWDAGIVRADFARKVEAPGSRTWARFPYALRRDGLIGGADDEPSGDSTGEPGDQALHACALAYLSDMNAMDAIVASRAGGPKPGEPWDGAWMGVSIDHALWFHRPLRADDWLLIDFSGHGLIRTRGSRRAASMQGTYGDHRAGGLHWMRARGRRPAPPPGWEQSHEAAPLRWRVVTRSRQGTLSATCAECCGGKMRPPSRTGHVSRTPDPAPRNASSLAGHFGCSRTPRRSRGPRGTPSASATRTRSASS